MSIQLKDLKRILDMEDVSDEELNEIISRRFRERMDASIAGKSPEIRHYRKIRTFHK